MCRIFFWNSAIFKHKFQNIFDDLSKIFINVDIDISTCDVINYGNESNIEQVNFKIFLDSYDMKYKFTVILLMNKYGFKYNYCEIQNRLIFSYSTPMSD